MIASPFFAVYMLEELKFSYYMYIAVILSSSIFYLLFLPLAGKFSDKYGNQSDGVVYRTFLEKTEADKVNWTADKTTLKVSILPEVWTTVFLLPDFTN